LRSSLPKKEQSLRVSRIGRERLAGEPLAMVDVVEECRDQRRTRRRVAQRVVLASFSEGIPSSALSWKSRAEVGAHRPAGFASRTRGVR
jgi:hypothetical protein